MPRHTQCFRCKDCIILLQHNIKAGSAKPLAIRSAVAQFSPSLQFGIVIPQQRNRGSPPARRSGSAAAGRGGAGSRGAGRAAARPGAGQGPRRSMVGRARRAWRGPRLARGVGSNGGPRASGGRRSRRRGQDSAARAGEFHRTGSGALGVGGQGRVERGSGGAGMEPSSARLGVGRPTVESRQMYIHGYARPPGSPLGPRPRPPAPGPRPPALSPVHPRPAPGPPPAPRAPLKRPPPLRPREPAQSWAPPLPTARPPHPPRPQRCMTGPSMAVMRAGCCARLPSDASCSHRDAAPWQPPRLPCLPRAARCLPLCPARKPCELCVVWGQEMPSAEDMYPQRLLKALSCPSRVQVCTALRGFTHFLAGPAWPQSSSIGRRGSELKCSSQVLRGSPSRARCRQFRVQAESGNESEPAKVCGGPVSSPLTHGYPEDGLRQPIEDELLCAAVQHRIWVLAQGRYLDRCRAHSLRIWPLLRTASLRSGSSGSWQCRADICLFGNLHWLDIHLPLQSCKKGVLWALLSDAGLGNMPVISSVCFAVSPCRIRNEHMQGLVTLWIFWGSRSQLSKILH